jgi:SAM-dependent methyltransferase
VCLLGLGASGTLLSLLPPIAPERSRGVAVVFAALAALAVPAAHVAFVRLDPDFNAPGARSIAALIALSLPYLFLGAVVAVVLAARGEGVGRAYAFNLAGSAAGCLIVFPLLDRLGAERSLVVIALLVLAGAALLAGRNAKLLAAAGVLALAAIPAWSRADSLFAFAPDRTGQLARLFQATDEFRKRFPEHSFTIDHEFEQWDRTARIDVYRLDSTLPELQGLPVPSLFFVQDSSAGSLLFETGDDFAKAAPFFDDTVYGAGYACGPVDSVLVVGLGGAPDVQAALHHGASRVVGVEINRTTIDLIRERYAATVGSPYQRPDVRVEHIDGRTFLRSTDDTFDLIQLSGVDVKSKFSPGTLSASENFLYTTEAIGEMLDRLEPGGLIAIARFEDEEAFRLVSIAAAALHERGSTDPSKHLFVAKQGSWRCVLVRREPFPAEELARLHAWAERTHGAPPRVVIPPYHWIGLSLNVPIEVEFSPAPLPVATKPLYEALARGELQTFIAAEQKLDLTPPSDDRPFFFLHLRPGRALFESPAFLFLHKLLAQLCGIAAVFILLPLLVLRGRGLRMPRAGRALLYFACLGVGFMFVEIGLIHNFVLLLGHQSYAISVVLLGLLVGASIGAALSRRVGVATAGPLRRVLLGLIATVVVGSFLLGPLFGAASGLPFGARLAVALVALVGIGIPLGVPFPTMLRALHGAKDEHVAFVPWGLGVNGFASVIGATLALGVAMLVGLQSLLLIGAALYGVAMLVAPGGEAVGRRP